MIAVCAQALSTIDDPSHTEIAFFGGSFTALPRREMESLLKAAYRFVEAGQVSGIRLSTRPDAIDEEILSLLKRYGVTAIELGAQSMDDAVLRQCGRGHTAQDVRDASRQICAAGFALGLQMMTGLPGASADSDRRTATELAVLQPQTVRVYPTLVLEHTPLAAWYRNGAYQPQTKEEAIALGAWLLHYFEIERGIRVIRMGLQDEDDLKRHLIAGPFLPAFREWCENRLYFDMALDRLPPPDSTAWTLAVHPSAVSKMVGQRRCNVEKLAARGYRVRVTAHTQVPMWDILIEKGK